MIVNTRTGVNACAVYDMRQSGASLQQIANRMGRTKERVRQILIENYGSTRRKLISTEQLGRILDLYRNRIIELYQDGVITPAAEWDTGNRHYLLWSPDTVEQIIGYYKTHQICRICCHPIPKGRRFYCSEECCREGQKYRYKKAEAKQRHIRSVERYKENRRSGRQVRQAACHLALVPTKPREMVKAAVSVD